ncbi:hypothetical protein QA640_23040 [Bradyrhizobium sp. CB82]|uniref:hypothetical protein n=1 Tax=Bradyrhizobium sp. CB82 TaxID=3039159 RepID=UPI0024B1FF18|nr:hypothetical protein [Bradyrhizobium sp. CB82]WFU37369.1 hypothetical protein QA640_23040 [Bradyrhizobium sp. CB82]
MCDLLWRLGFGRGRGRAIRLALELDAALLGNRGLLDRDQLPFHLPKLCRGLLVATHKESCRPEDHDGGGRSDNILCALAILCAR